MITLLSRLRRRGIPRHDPNLDSNICYFSRDIFSGFWKGDAPDAKVKNPAKYEELCRRRAARARSFITSDIISGDVFVSPVPFGQIISETPAH